MKSLKLTYIIKLKVEITKIKELKVVSFSNTFNIFAEIRIKISLIEHIKDNKLLYKNSIKLLEEFIRNIFKGSVVKDKTLTLI